ncbi:MAG: PaaI family thioesterase [Gemmatimonas sp.]
MSKSPGVVSEPKAQELAERIVERMMSIDSLVQHLGIESASVSPGSSVLRMTVRDGMSNGNGGLHGGVVYALADTAFSFATNNTGIISVGIDCSISYPAAARPGDVLTASAVVESGSNRLQFCVVEVRTQAGTVVALFRGTVFRTQKPHAVVAEMLADDPNIQKEKNS